MAAVPEHFTLEEIAPGIHVAIATPQGFGLCNSAIVDLGGRTLVFDSMLTPQAGEALGRAARRLTGRPVDFLVNSHYHGDHVRGNASLEAGHIVSTHRVRELILERASDHLASDRREAAAELESLRAGRTSATPAERATLEGWFEGILATPEGWLVPPPDLTLSDSLVIRGRRREAHILSFGGGHSPSDVLVHLPDERIVLLGDLLSIGFHPSLWDGDPRELARILDQVRGLGATTALPGHGPLGRDLDVRRMGEYVAVLERLATGLREREDRASEVARTPAPAPFDAWIFSSFFAQNLSFVVGRPPA
ncbi:MAG TPA: MBL fold metallo-hydrolase [Thermoplasmata archaeon]|nr:MBL fold metallo-hydrolase [Thermoplasmata archaeon]